jgi:hypothetical protein
MEDAMHYYLILDSDYAETGAMIQIIQSSSGLEDLDVIKTYDPTKKITIPNRKFKFLKHHDVKNILSGTTQLARIYKA